MCSAMLGGDGLGIDIWCLTMDMACKCEAVLCSVDVEMRWWIFEQRGTPFSGWNGMREERLMVFYDV